MQDTRMFINTKLNVKITSFYLIHMKVCTRCNNINAIPIQDFCRTVCLFVTGHVRNGYTNLNGTLLGK